MKVYVTNRQQTKHDMPYQNGALGQRVYITPLSLKELTKRDIFYVELPLWRLREYRPQIEAMIEAYKRPSSMRAGL